MPTPPILDAPLLELTMARKMSDLFRFFTRDEWAAVPQDRKHKVGMQWYVLELDPATVVNGQVAIQSSVLRPIKIRKEA